MHIFLNDYGGYPFPFQLSVELARRGHDVRHAYCGTLAGTPQSDFVHRESSLQVCRIDLDQTQQKTSFLKRRRQDIEYGRKCVAEITSRRPDVVVSANTPLDAQKRIVACCRRHDIPLVFWWQDVIGLAIDKVLRRKFPGLGRLIGAWYRSLERSLICRSDHVVPIADRFADLLKSWQVAPDRYTVIPNWAPIADLPRHRKDNDYSRPRGLHDRPVLMYSGTLSLKHDPTLLSDLAAACADTGAIVVVRSTGVGADQLRAVIARDRLRNLVVEDFGPFAETPLAFATADVLVAVLEPEAGEFSVPSKVLAYLCAGRPLLLSVPIDNAAARIVSDSGSGCVASPGDRSAFIAQALRLIGDADRRAEMGDAARRYAETHFQIDAVTDRFEAVLRKLTGAD